MPLFELQGPDGARYQIDAPDERAALSAFQKFSTPDETAQKAPAIGVQLGAPERPAISDYQPTPDEFAADDAAIAARRAAASTPGFSRAMRSEAATRNPQDAARMSMTDYGVPVASSMFAPQTPSRHQGMLDEAVVSGLSKLAGTPGDAMHLVDNLPGVGINAASRLVGGGQILPPLPGVVPGSDYFRDKATEAGFLGNPDYQPKTPGERFFYHGVEGAMASPFGPAALGYGALSGLGGEAAAETLGEKYRWIGQLATPLGVMAAKRLILASPDKAVAGQLSRLSEPQIVQARELFDRARDMGRPITVAEAIAQVTGGRNTRLLNAQRIAEQSEGGSNILEPMMAQRARTNQALPSQVEDIGPRPADAGTVVPRLQTAAEGVQQGARDVRNAITKPLYDATTGTPSVGISQQAWQTLSGDPAITEAVRAVRADPVRYGNLAGAADNSVKVLDAAMKWLADEAADASRAGRNFANANLTSAQAKIMGAIQNEPGIAQLYPLARQAQSQLFQQLDEPIARSQVGSLARITAEDAEKRFGQAASILFPKDPAAVTPAAVAKAIRQLTFKDPTAARDFTRLYLESEFNKTVGNIARAPEFAGAKFRDTIMGNPQQAANLEAAIKALPNGDRAWGGFKTLMDVFEAQGRRLPAGSPTAFNEATIEGMKGGSKLAGVAKSLANPTQIPGRFRNALDWMQYGRNTERLAEILTDPETLSKLGKLRLMKPGSPAAAAVAAQVLARPSETRVNRERR